MQLSQGALCSHPAALITYCAPFSHVIPATEAFYNLTCQGVSHSQCVTCQIVIRWDFADKEQLQSHSSTNNWNCCSQTRHYPETGLEAKHISAFVMPDCTLIQQKQTGHLEGIGEEKPLKSDLQKPQKLVPKRARQNMLTDLYLLFSVCLEYNYVDVLAGKSEKKSVLYNVWGKITKACCCPTRSPLCCRSVCPVLFLLVLYLQYGNSRKEG